MKCGCKKGKMYKGRHHKGMYGEHGGKMLAKKMAKRMKKIGM
jgi:hypothetical protein